MCMCDKTAFSKPTCVASFLVVHCPYIYLSQHFTHCTAAVTLVIHTNCANTTGRKQLSRALELFLQGITAPTMVCSAITAAAYKKYALVSLIHNGAWWGGS